MALWDEAPDIACVHPTAPLIAGRTAIEASWRHIFDAAPGGMDISPLLRVAHSSDEIAVHIVEERLGESGLAIATNIYRRRLTGWRMVVHHASPGGVRSAARPAHVH
jgi:ketosteroid isomerase-like protein